MGSENLTCARCQVGQGRECECRDADRDDWRVTRAQVWWFVITIGLAFWAALLGAAWRYWS